MLAFLATLVVVVALTWPAAVQLGATHHPSAFGASHAWFGLHLHEVIFGDRTLSPTNAIGYPGTRLGHYIGWLPALAGQPLQPLLGALGTHQLLELLVLPLSAAATVPLLRRWTGAESAALVAGAVVYATCPYLLGTLQMGEVPKLHAWWLPLFLLGFERALERRGVVLLAAVCVATAFTSPYYGLAMPLLAVGMALRAPIAALRPLVVVALALVPALLYYQGIPDGLHNALFQPAKLVRFAELAVPHQVATMQDLFWPSAPIERGSFEAFHLTYLGWPALLAGLLAWGRPGARQGVVLLLVGVLLAAGPRLATDAGYTFLALPAVVLEVIDYPYAQGGMYFRLVLVAALGLGVLVTAASTRSVWLGVALLLLQTGDAVRASGPWPWTLEPVPAREALAAIGSGAVLQLPLQFGPSQVEGQRGLLHALSHRRPTTSLPRDVLGLEAKNSRASLRRLLSDIDGLRAQGYAAIVLDENLEQDTAAYTRLRKLDVPIEDQDGVRVWYLDP